METDKSVRQRSAEIFRDLATSPNAEVQWVLGGIENKMAIGIFLVRKNLANGLEGMVDPPNRLVDALIEALSLALAQPSDE